MKQRIFTLRQIIKEGAAVLEEAGIDDGARDAWYLLEYVTGISRAAYYGDPDQALEEGQVLQYLACIGRRKERIPLQHITGEQEFMGYPFFVNAHVLIPRQDTETLVEEAVKVIRGKKREAGWDGRENVSGGHVPDGSIRVLDLCTGSGCILLSILKMCPEAEGVGCDISKDALDVARKNACRLNVGADWVCSDLFDGLRDGGNAEVLDTMKYDIIVSNPPYIRTQDIEGLQDEVRFHDPRIALDGGEDGLDFYRRIMKDSVSYIKKGGNLLFEIGCGQGEDVADLMISHGYNDVTVKKDLSGLDRVVTGIYNR